MLKKPKSTYIKKKYEDRIDIIEHDIDGWWIYLDAGWYWDDKGLHIIHEDTKAEAIAQLKYTRPCNCKDCEEIKKEREV